MTAFKTIRARAAKRKGGEAALATLLPKVTEQKTLASLADDRVLAEMTKRIFSAGFAWSVIEAKWPGFEGLPGVSASAPAGPARRVLGRPCRRQTHRSQRAEDHGRAGECPLHRRHRPGARQLRQVAGGLAGR
jgi:hypothetical protein